MQSDRKELPVRHIHGNLVNLWIELIQAERNSTNLDELKKSNDLATRQILKSAQPLTEFEINERKRGFCQGIAMMGLQACLLGNSDRLKFNDRILTLSELDAVQFAQNAQLIKAKLSEKAAKLRLKFTENQNRPIRLRLNLDEEFLYDTLAFFNCAELYHRPQRHIQLFKEDDDDDIILDHRNIEYISQFTSPSREDNNDLKQGLSEVHHNYAQFDSLSLLNYLRLIELEITKTNLTSNFGLILTSISHTINLSYNASSKKWIMIDANQLPLIEEPLTEELTMKTMYGFGINSCLTITGVCATSKKDTVHSPVSSQEVSIPKTRIF